MAHHSYTVPETRILLLVAFLGLFHVFQHALKNGVLARPKLVIRQGSTAIGEVISHHFVVNHQIQILATQGRMNTFAVVITSLLRSLSLVVVVVAEGWALHLGVTISPAGVAPNLGTTSLAGVTIAITASILTIPTYATRPLQPLHLFLQLRNVHR